MYIIYELLIYCFVYIRQLALNVNFQRINVWELYMATRIKGV